MVVPSGDQFEIAAADYAAVITESGAALRSLSHGGRDLIHGFPEGEMATGGRGQLLMPWPNRIRDGHYVFRGTSHQLGLTDPAHGNASHGLVRWVSWTLEEHTSTSVSLTYRLMAQTGYPWAVDLHVLYDLSADGLQVTQTATNLSHEPAPYASGAHPYLRVGDAIDPLELQVPAGQHLLVDDRLLPCGRRPSEGAFDFRSPRVVGDTPLDLALGDLDHVDGVASVLLRDPSSDRGVSLWMDSHHRWVQIFTPPATAGVRPGLAVEPMTAPPDAYNSGEDLTVLAPSGTSGDELSVSWGIRVVLPQSSY